MSLRDWVHLLLKGSTRGRMDPWSTITPRRFAWLTVLASLALSLLSVYAIDLGMRFDPRGHSAVLDPTALRQLVFVVMGLGIMIAAATPHFRLLMHFGWPAYILCIGLLVFLLVPAVPESIVTPRNGTRGWINLRVFDFQPAEVTKIAFVMVVAQFLRFRRSHRRFFGLVPPGLIALPPVVLITLQPDLGTAMLFVPALFAMLLAAGARLRHLTIIVLVAALAAPASYPLLKDHQKARINALVLQFRGDTSADDAGNYQSLTAQRIAGAGEVAGVGDEHARAIIRYNRLPERHNDMIYSVIVHRLGLVGGVGVMLLYLLWVVGALATAAMSRHAYGRLLVVGFAAFVAAQMFINIGMNIGLLPIIGITLPYLSYGGSSMLTQWIMTGLVLNVGLRRPIPPIRPSFEYADDDD